MLFGNIFFCVFLEVLYGYFQFFLVMDDVIYYYYYFQKKLMDALRALVKKKFLEIFYGKRKKVTFLTTFYIFHESGIKTSLNGLSKMS